MTAERPGPQARRARLATHGAFVIGGLLFVVVVARLPTFKTEFGLSDTDLLLIVLLLSVLAAFGSLVAGYAAQQFGSRRTLRVLLACVSVAALLTGLAWDPASLIVALSGFGLCFGAADAATNMQGVAVQSRYGRSIMALFHAVWSAAAVVGALYAAVTIELGWSPVAYFGGVAVLALVSGAGLGQWFLRRDLPSVPDDEARTPAEARRLPWWPVLLIGIPAFTTWFADSATSNWSGLYLTDGLGEAASVAPLAYGAFQAALVLTRLVGDRAVTRYGATVVVAVCGLTAVLGSAVIVIAPNVPLVLTGFVLLGLGIAVVPPLCYIAAASLDERSANIAVARINMASYAGYIGGAVVTWLAATGLGHRWMYVAMLAVVPLIPLMARQLRPRTDQVLTAAERAARRSRRLTVRRDG